MHMMGEEFESYCLNYDIILLILQLRNSARKYGIHSETKMTQNS